MAKADLTAPTRELGAPQWTYGSDDPLLEEWETSDALTWPHSVETYAGMLNDAHVDGMYRGLIFPIRGYRWYLDPNGAAEPTVTRISSTFNLPVGPEGRIDQRRTARRFVFNDHLADALRAPAYGHYPFEQVYAVTDDGDPRVNDGWVARLRKLAPRPPRSIMEIRPARDGGLAYIKVPALNPQAQSDLTGGVKLPVDRLVMYCWDREGAAWQGRSMLRSLYRPFTLKDRVMRVGAVNIERAGGVPYVAAAEGTSGTQMRELQQLASEFRVSASGGAALPYGAQLKFAAASGGDGAVEFIRLQNEEMARAWVQMLMVLGQTQTGSRALGETFADRADLVQNAIAEWFCDTFNRHVIEDDVEINEGPDAPYAPLLRFAPVGDPVDGLAGALDDAQAAGALPADSRVAAAVRGDRPRRAADRRRREIAAAVPPRSRNQRLPDRPLRRQPTEVEIRAAVDFAALEQQLDDGVDGLLADWQTVRVGQVEELVEQITAAGGDLERLAQVAATPAGADVLLARMVDAGLQGAAGALEEAIEQGVTGLVMPSADELRDLLEPRAQATATLLARALSEAAGRRALAQAGTVLTPDEVAEDVRGYIDGLTDAYLRDQFNGAVMSAENSGRRGTMSTVDTAQAVRYYASELLDSATCGPCAAVDGKEYDTLADAERDYPTGGHSGCLGGPRCRGTIVAVYPEN